MTELAYESDELGLDETERVKIEHLARQAGTCSAEELIGVLRKHGENGRPVKVDGVMEAALTLPLDEYREVEAVYKDADEPRRPTRRRGR